MFPVCQHLVLTPHGNQVKSLNTGVVLTCSVVEYSPTSGRPPMRWFGPMGTEITSSSGRWVMLTDIFASPCHSVLRLTPKMLTLLPGYFRIVPCILSEGHIS